MKVPRYTAQVERRSGGTGGALTAQVSPRAMTAGAEVVQRIGQSLTEFGFERLKIQTEAQAAEAERAMDLEIQSVVDEANRLPTTQEDQEATVNRINSIYDKYASGRAINPVTNKSYLPSNASRLRFRTSSQETYSKHLIDYRDKSNERIVELGKAESNNAINKHIQGVTDTSLPQEERLANFYKIFSSEPILNEKGEIVDYEGEITRSFARGFRSGKELYEVGENSVEQIVVGTAQSLMQSSDDAGGIALEIANGTITDPILQAAFAQVEPEQRATLTTTLINLADKIETERDRAVEEADRISRQTADNAFLKILNTDTTDPEQVATSRERHQILLSNNYYDTPAKRKAAESILGLDASDEKREDDITAVEKLVRLDNDNLLTLDAVIQFRDQLKPSTYEKYLNKANNERVAGENNATSIISQSLRYERYKEGVGPIADATNKLHAQAVLEFERWLITPPEPGQPMTGGRGASYQTITEYAFKLGEDYQQRLNPIIQRAFDNYVIGLNTLRGTIESITGNPLVIDPNDRKASIQSYFRSIDPSLLSNSILRGQMDGIVPFLSEDVK